ncbi:MAG TPA: c-type cytochrome [Flavobacterium sp.]|nr:c-type cytochrome [Flavobacterium sp.]
MNRLFLLLTVLLLVSCKEEAPKGPLYPNAKPEAQTPDQLGKEIFESKGNCFACHKPDQKIIGPSLQEIAKTYKDKKGDIVSFLKGNEEPLVDPEQFPVMKTNFAITKSMSDEELKALEAYIYSNLK